MINIYIYYIIFKLNMTQTYLTFISILDIKDRQINDLF